jgi:hypothetical protein
MGRAIIIPLFFDPGFIKSLMGPSDTNTFLPLNGA